MQKGNTIGIVPGLFLLRAAFLTEVSAPAQDTGAALVRAVRPFLEKNCQSCHKTGLPSGGVDMQQLLATPNSLGVGHDTWDDIAFQIRSGQMPSAVDGNTAGTD